jgi:phytol kinase
MLALISVLLALALLLVTVRWWQKRYRPHPEWARKALHIGVGLIGFSFPFIFVGQGDARLLVWLTCAIAALTMLGIRLARPLQRGFGAILGSVNRVSTGEFYFLLGLAALYTLTAGGALYGTALAILTFADATAALVGTFYGQRRYEKQPGSKTLEGSLGFALVCFVICLLGLLVNGQAAIEGLLIAAIVTLIAALLEALAKDGLDNLLLPVVSYLLLRGLVGLDGWALAVALVCTGVIALQLIPWQQLREVKSNATARGEAQ